MKGFIKVVIIFLLVSIVLVAVSILINSRSEEGESVQGLVDYSIFPAVINMPPTQAFVESQYRYDIAITDSDTDIKDIRITLIESPKWIEMFDHTIFGTPSVEDIGDTKIVYEISDGENSVFETFYVVVSKSNEGI